MTESSSAQPRSEPLNCKDGDNAKFIVNGGRFYKFNPETDNPGEVVLGEGCTVTTDGDWYVVSK